MGRVPLHRRGTSKTYERLEDLLREAGYKETRVFTPETERTTSLLETQARRATSSLRGGVGSVVGFFTGLVSRKSTFIHDPGTTGDSPLLSPQAIEPQAWSTPPSPFSRTEQLSGPSKLRPASPSASTSDFPPSASSESLHITMRPTRITSGRVPALHAEPTRRAAHHTRQSHQYSHPPPQRTHQHPRPGFPYQQSVLPSSEMLSAHAYLRHMASAPSIPQLGRRPSASEVSLRSHQQSYQPTRRHGRGTKRPTISLNDQDVIPDYEYKGEVHDYEPQPPLPRNWLESVAKAILAGAGTAPPDALSPHAVTEWPDISMPDSPGTSHKKRLAKPMLLCPHSGQKAKLCEGHVHRARVLCRSAPTSRASSRVRNTAANEQVGSITNKRTRPGKVPVERLSAHVRREKGKGRDVDIVPSLATTEMEDDEWNPEHRYLSGWGVDDDHEDDVSSEGDGDDEGELGLDRLLVPARRQHSIQSLRRHLHHPAGEIVNNPTKGTPNRGRTRAFAEGRAVQPGRSDWTKNSWSSNRGPARSCEEDDDGEDGCGYIFSGGKANTAGRNRQRRGLPGTWSQWGAT